MADTNPLAFLSFVNPDFPTRIELVEDAHDEKSSKGPASLIAFINLVISAANLERASGAFPRTADRYG